MKDIGTIANRLVELCRACEFDTAIDELYSDNIVSDEPIGTPLNHVEGISGVRGKTAHFNENFKVDAITVSDPLVTDNAFTIKMALDCTHKEAGKVHMEEICVYEVLNGKITHEHFFYTPHATA